MFDLDLCEFLVVIVCYCKSGDWYAGLLMLWDRFGMDAARSNGRELFWYEKYGKRITDRQYFIFMYERSGLLIERNSSLYDIRRIRCQGMPLKLVHRKDN